MNREHASRSTIVSALLSGTMLAMFSSPAFADRSEIEVVIEKVKQLQGKGENASAKSILDRYLEKHPKDVKALCYRGIICNPIDFKQCQKDLSQALSLSAGDEKQLPIGIPTILIVRAFANAHIDRRQQAFADIEQARKLAPNAGEVYHVKGCIERKYGMIREAFADFEHGAKLSPDHEICVERAKECASQLKLKDKELYWNEKLIGIRPTVDRLYTQAGLLTEAGRRKEALVYIEKAKDLAPNNEEIRVFQLETLTVLLRSKDAIAAADDALKVFPNSARIMRLRAHAFHVSGERDKSVAAYKELIRIHPDFVRGYEELATVLRMQNRYEDAIGYLQKAARIHEPTEDILILRSDCYKKAQMHKEAVQDFERLYKLTGKRLFLLDVGDGYLALGQYDKAIGAFNQALDPKLKQPPLVRFQLIHAYTGKGHAHFRINQFKEAAIDAEEAVKLDTNNFAAYLLRGEANAKQGKLDAAIEDYSRVIKIKPEFVPAYDQRAKLYERTKNFALADRDRKTLSTLGHGFENDFFPSTGKSARKTARPN